MKLMRFDVAQSGRAELILSKTGCLHLESQTQPRTAKILHCVHMLII